MITQKELKRLLELVKAERADLESSARTVAADLPPKVLLELAAAFLVAETRKAYRLDTLGVERRAASLVDQAHAQAIQESLARGRTTHWTEEEALAAKVRSEQALEESLAREAELRQRHWNEMTSLLQRYTAEMKMEWTEELLSAGFTLPDGTETTWGDATLEQHEERREMFTHNAIANAEGAARHQQAVDELRRSGAACLRDALKSKAA